MTTGQDMDDLHAKAKAARIKQLGKVAVSFALLRTVVDEALSLTDAERDKVWDHQNTLKSMKSPSY